jgi:hypothetical protein
MIVYAVVAGIKAAIAWLVWDFLIVASLTMVVPKAASTHTSYKAFFVLCVIWEIISAMWTGKKTAPTNASGTAN